MAGSKKWMYQVNAKTDDKGLVVTKSEGNDCFSAKIGGTYLSHVASMSIDENGNGKYTLGWNVPSEKDYNGAVVSYGIKGSAPLGFQVSHFSGKMTFSPECAILIL